MQETSIAQSDSRLRIGVFAVGLEAYWEQFPDLKPDIEDRLRAIEDRLGQWGEVVVFGIADSAMTGVTAGEHFARERIDLLIGFMGTYATSSIALPTIQRAAVPVIVLHLQPAAAMTYATAGTSEVLQFAGLCGVPELTGILRRAGVRFAVVSGYVGDAAVWEELHGWCRAAKAAASLRSGRFGVLGHTYPGMLDMATDYALVTATFGAHVEVLEIEDVRDRADAAAASDVASTMEFLRETFAGVEHVSPAGLRECARIAVGLDRLVADFALNGLAYYYRGSGGDRVAQVASNLIVGNTLLTLRGIPAAGEGDLKTALAMKLLHELGCGGSFTEFLAMDFTDQFFLMGHDGPCHPGIANGQVVLKELDLFHGKAGGGVAVEMRAIAGPVTMVCLAQGSAGALRLLVAEGESLPGAVPAIGNSCHRLRFCGDPAAFMAAWCEAAPTHHVALGVGHCARDVLRAGMLMGLDVVEVR